MLSLGQDPRWRHALVSSLGARRDDIVLDVATGTGLVAEEIERRYGCRVVGLDQSADMLAAAAARNGHSPRLVRGGAERLPFADATFDHVTFTYLLRYVDHPDATVRELARVLRPGGRLAALEFGVPRGPLYALWVLYTRIFLPVLGRLFSSRWSAVGAFLGPSIERFYRAHPQQQIEQAWRDAGLVNVTARRMSLGAAIVMSATKPALSDVRAAGATETLSTRRIPALVARGPLVARGSSVAPARLASVAPPLDERRSAFYALAPGGWRDYWTLLHPPYTAWHLSYVLMGAALAPMPDPRLVGGAALAFFLGVGIAAHSFDELRGRPLATRIPSGVLVALGAIGLGGAIALGIGAAALVGTGYLLFVGLGAALVLAYAFEIPVVHSDLGFALSWGGFPVLATAFAVGAAPVPSALVAVAASLVSLAQRRLSTPVRRIRRKAVSVSGEVAYRDGSREALDAPALIAAPESALRLLWLAMVALSIGALAARWWPH